MNTPETDEQTAARLGVSLEDYHRVIAAQDADVARLCGKTISDGEFEGHTPGPWHYMQVGIPFTGFEVMQRVEKGFGTGIARLPIMNERNAKLIAAAPALLAERDTLRQRVERLERVCSWVQSDLKNYGRVMPTTAAQITALNQTEAQ